MKKIELILDTDIGGDCDDMMALAYLVYATRYRNVELKAITHCNGCPHGAELIQSFFEFLGEKVPPIGHAAKGTKAFDTYASLVTERFGVSEKMPTADAVTTLRRALAESDKAVLCAIGPLTNIAALLESKGDEISPLDGASLIREHCEKLVLMAGGFVPGEDGRNRPEFNAYVDIEATQKTVALCPIPMVFLPFETGLDMLTGKPMMDTFHDTTPLSLSFVSHGHTKEHGGRHSWDPATVLYVVEGLADRFKESEGGRVTVDGEGRTTLVPEKNGIHSVLTVKTHDGISESDCKARIAAYIDACAMKVHEGI
ncbi:MAG: hypothetical protein E7668_01250 [Ruminococcaceae bacterium]|nr:hypothetical protein [Oscillospiraceae bacterium]